MKLTFLSLVCFAFPAYAFDLDAFNLDFTPDASRIVSDPTYLPLQGQVFGQTGYEYYRTKEDRYNNLGVQVSSLTHSAQEINQTLEYGISDDLSIRAEGTYTPESKDHYTSGLEYDFTGLKDPIFTGIWRAFDQNDYPVDVDISASFSPNLISARVATFNFTGGNTTGTVADGGDVAGTELSVGYKTHSFTIQGSGGVTYYGATKYYDPDIGNSDHFSNYLGFNAGVRTQTRVTDLVSLDADYTLSTRNPLHVLGNRDSYNFNVQDKVTYENVP